MSTRTSPRRPATGGAAEDDALAVSPSPLVMPASTSRSRSDSIDVDSLSPLPPARIDTSIDVLGPPTSALPTWSLEGGGGDDLSPVEERLPEPLPLSGARNGSVPAKRAHFAIPSGSSASASTSYDNSQPQYARYVTVSAILSRSGAYIVSQDGDPTDQDSPPSSDEGSEADADASGEDAGDGKAASRSAEDLVTTLTKRRKRNRDSADVRRGNANGSALEALGALLLKRDSAGRASNLSSTRYARAAASRATGGNERDKATSRASDLFSRVSQSWLRSVREAAGAANVGLRMPGQADGDGSTIAERRTRKNGIAPGSDAPVRVGTKRSQPSFVLERPPAPRAPLSPKTLRSSSNAPPLRRTQSEAPRLGPHADDDDISPLLEPVEPETVTLHSRPPRSRGYGQGSAFGIQDPLEAPPSPVGMPGAWSGGNGWRARPGDGHEEGALLLPPPLLDQGSDAQSFEGLLGVRRMREREKALKEYQRLAARNRPLKKKGMLTALSNFVQAAHAADQAIKAANKAAGGVAPSGKAGTRLRPAFMSRRHTEPGPAKGKDVGEERGDAAADVLVETTNEPPRARMAPRSSLESAGRSLSTVPEAENSPAIDDRRASQGDDAASHAEEDSRTHSKDSSAASSSSWASTSYDRPRAPHLLPVNLSVPPSPFTPIVGRTPLQGPVSDYMHARPKSPWTPKLGPLTSGSYRLHLNMAAPHGSGTSGLGTPLVPGTPRLAPVSIDMIPSPSPFPSPAPSLPSSSPRMRALASNGAAISSSPIMNPLDGVMDAMQRGLVSPTVLPSLGAAAAAPSTSQVPPPSTQSSNILRQRRKGSLDLATANRMTPSSMLSGAYISTALPPVSAIAPVSPNPRPTLSRPGSAHRRSSSMRRSSSAQSQRGAAAQAAATTQRSFLLWFLFGDLGLRSRREATGDTASSYGGVVLFLMHLWGFVIFLLAHLIDLGYRIAETTGVTLWFLKWLFLNLTGRTVLSRCVVDAYGLIKAEWETVALEDHEDRGHKRRRASFDSAAFGAAEEDDDEDEGQPKGLTRWDVVRGLVELACLQAVTRERYLREGAGLELFKDWRKKGAVRRRARQNGTSMTNGSNGAAKGPIDIGSHRERQREALSARLEQQRRDEDEERHSFASSEEEDDSSSDDESSDDDLVVTRQGADVLEFSKTPRLEPRRASLLERSGSIGSVGSSVGASLGSGNYFSGGVPGSEALPSTALSPRSPTLSSVADAAPTAPGSGPESPRSLVKTIKWASRLAISAYGLHVTLVDLPPTFTPSGERFSRQTFAHLSRLRSDDVLHADIQALDSDAYSPTFYLVRDFKRRIVVVSVRGTQSLQDIIVDLEFNTARMDLPPIDVLRRDEATSDELTCHAGILRAAKALLERESSLFKILSQAMEENEGFGVVFTGHSLGAAIACTSVLLLSEYRKPSNPRADPKKGHWVTRSDVGLPAGRPIRAIGFAHPASVSAALAERASLGAVPLVVSVVLGSDIIPRCGHGQARELRRVLGALSRVRRRAEQGRKKQQLVAGGKAPLPDEEEDARVHIVRSWWDWRSLRRQTGEEEGQTLMKGIKSKAERIEDQLWRLRRDVEADLYAAVRRRTESTARGDDEEEGSERRPLAVPPSPWTGPRGRETAPLHQLAARRQALDAATLRSEEAQGGVLVPPGQSYWIPSEGDDIFVVTSPLSFFGLPDLDPSLFSAHLPSAYEAKLSEDIK